MQSPTTTQPPDDGAFRTALRAVVDRSGRSLRSLSLAMGRDPGYVAALLDPSRPSRARPTPDDLLALSDETGVPFVELLQALWGIEPARLAAELARQAPAGAAISLPGSLTREDRELVVAFVALLAARRSGPTTRR